MARGRRPLGAPRPASTSGRTMRGRSRACLGEPQPTCPLSPPPTELVRTHTPLIRSVQSGTTSRGPRSAGRKSMKREILINANPRETRVAILEDEQLVELLVDRPDARRMVGDIYLGRE